ncbi:hypothetical protein ACFX13_012434 [Malus domestica]
MLRMRLKIFTPLEGAARAKQLPAKILSVACRDHLLIADIPMAKGISAATTTTLVKIVFVAHVASLENGSTWWSCGGWEGPQWTG